MSKIRNENIVELNARTQAHVNHISAAMPAARWSEYEIGYAAKQNDHETDESEWRIR